MDNKLMIVPVKQTFQLDVMYNLYYEPAERARDNIKYLALHKEGLTKYIGKVKDTCIVTIKNGNILFEKNIDEDFKKNIIDMIDLISYKDKQEDNYLKSYPNIFYNIERYVPMENNNNNYLLRASIFKNLSELLEKNDEDKSIEEIANLLNGKI